MAWQVEAHQLPWMPNGSAFSGVAQPCTAPAEAWGAAILPPSKQHKRHHARCNGLLGSKRPTREFSAFPGPEAAEIRQGEPLDETVRPATRLP